MHFTKRIRIGTQFFLPFTQGSPQFGDSETADCLFIQSYGRGTYTDAEVYIKLQELRQQVGNNDILTFDLLCQQNFIAGVSNQQLAILAKQISINKKLVIISQWEVAFAIYNSDPKWYLENKERIIALWPGKEYYDTPQVKNDCVRVMKELDLKRPIELAHQVMILRATMIIWKLGVAAIPYNKCKISYDRKSTQI